MNRSITADPSRGGSGIRLKAASTTLVTPRSTMTRATVPSGRHVRSTHAARTAMMMFVAGPASDTISAWFRGDRSLPMFTGTGFA